MKYYAVRLCDGRYVSIKRNGSKLFAQLMALPDRRRRTADYEKAKRVHARLVQGESLWRKTPRNEFGLSLIVQEHQHLESSIVELTVT